MNEINVYGSSDDIINIEGDVDEQFYAKYDEPTQLYVDGTVLEVYYTDTWSVERIKTRDDHTTVRHKVGSEKSDQYCSYSDVFTVKSESEFKTIGRLDELDEKDLEQRELIQQWRDEADNSATVEERATWIHCAEQLEKTLDNHE